MSEDTPDINLTPLIDVVFVVLIVFMLLAPLLELDRVILAPGKEEPIGVQTGSPLAIHVRADNSIWLGDVQVSEKNLDALCKTLHASHPGERPQLFHDARACFGTYQSIKNALEAAGYEELDVILQPR